MTRQRARVGAVLRLLLALVVIAIVVVVARRAIGDVDAVLDVIVTIDFIDAVVMLTSLLSVMVANGAIVREVLKTAGVNVPWRDALGVTFVASMLNLVSPLSGAGAMRALYFHRYYGLALSSFAGVVTITSSTSLAMTGLLGALCLVMLGVPGGAAGIVALVVSLAPTLGLAAAIVISRTWSPNDAVATPSAGLVMKVRVQLQRFSLVWRGLAARPASAGKVVTYNVASALLHGIAYATAFRMAGLGEPVAALASSAFARIGSIVAITPAGLGIYEAFGAVSATIVGADAAAAAVGVLVVRLASTLAAIGGGMAFFPLLAKMRSAQ
jgi:uncharacterized membrane protein YbhN (UPF0104 family)